MKWAIRISNSHFPLTKEEVETILQQEIDWIIELVGITECEEEKIKELIEKSAGTKSILLLEEVIQLENRPIEQYFQYQPPLLHSRSIEAVSFAVRYNKIQHTSPKTSRSSIERIIGKRIIEETGLKVDLDDPDLTFKVLQNNDTVITGWLHAETKFSDISDRSPKESPFFGGGAMKPMLSKLLVNLLYPHSASILDPFCGHGGILREIANLNLYAVGFEIGSKIAREAKINNSYHEEENIDLIIADALNPPLRRNSFEKMVTDPPYAVQSTTIGRDKEDLVNMWLTASSADEIIFALPDLMKIQITRKWDLQYAYKDYVHKSLTRIIRKVKLKK